MSGDRPREIHIVVDVEKLNAHGLSIDQVRDAIQKENVEIPGGTLEQGKWEVGLRTLGRIDATDQFNDIIIATRQRHAGRGRPTSATPRTRSQKVMTLAVHRATTARRFSSTSGAPPARTPSGSPRRSSRSSPRSGRRCRKGVTLTVNTDDSRFIYASIASLEEHLLWGSLLASLVVHVLHPEHPRGHHLVAGHSRRRSSPRSR